MCELMMWVISGFIIGCIGGFVIFIWCISQTGNPYYQNY